MRILLVENKMANIEAIKKALIEGGFVVDDACDTGDVLQKGEINSDARDVVFWSLENRRQIQAGDIWLDLITRKAYKSGQEVRLTSKEFCILEYLMRHPGQIITRDRLLSHGWDFNFSSLSNVVDVHINSIRKKLKLQGSERLKTVRGVGYQFI